MVWSGVEWCGVVWSGSVRASGEGKWHGEREW